MLLETRALTWFRPDPKQARKHTDAEEDRQLTESIREHGILQPPGALPDGKGIFGHRRVRCALAAGRKEAVFYLLDKPMSESEVRILQLTENIQRQDLTDVDLYLAVTELMALNPAWLKKDIAAHLHKDASMVTRILCVADLIPAAREAFLDGAFGFSKAYTIVKAGSEPGQRQMLASLLSGTSRDEGERQVRRQRHAQAPAVRVSRVKCPLPSGAVVQVSGEGINLDEAIEAAQEWVKEAKKAREQGLDAKTFERVCRDKAKRV